MAANIYCPHNATSCTLSPLYYYHWTIWLLIYTVHTMPHIALFHVVPIPLNYMAANIYCTHNATHCTVSPCYYYHWTTWLLIYTVHTMPHVEQSHAATNTTELHGCSYIYCPHNATRCTVSCCYYYHWTTRIWLLIYTVLTMPHIALSHPVTTTTELYGC